MSQGYRPEIDGLRAVAVVPVVLFHAGFALFAGGYVGVDVFFVISGYLITGILYDEIRRGEFSLITFYERRARRILPALLFVSLACIPFAWLWLLPEDFRLFSQSLVAVNLFSSNIFFWREIDYFSLPAEQMPLLHTWSLAVEEQFYFFYPLLLLSLAWATKRSLLLILAAIFLASLGLAEWGSRNHAGASFYLLPTRAWELMAGAMIAIVLHENTLRFRRLIHEAGSVLGLALILVAILFFDENTPFPSVWTLVPVAGTAMVILFSRADTLSGRILGWKPIVVVGLLSYSIYLWHQPVFAFARERSLHSLTPMDFLLLCVLVLVLSTLSWRYVEQPFRSRKRVSRAKIFSAGLGTSAALLLFGVYGTLTQGVPERMDQRVVQLASMKHDRYEMAGGCQVYPGRYVRPVRACEFNGEHDRMIAVWGDSHAATLVEALETELDEYGYGVKQLVHTNCLPIVGYKRSDGQSSCTRYNEEAFDYLLGSDDIDIVVMLARYPLQIEGERFDNREGGVESGHRLYAMPLDEGMEGRDRIESVGLLLRDTIDRLRESGKRVVLVYPVPEVGWDVPNFLAKEVLYGIEREAPLSTSHEVFQERVAATYDQLALSEPGDDLIRIKPERLFCNTYRPGRCVAEMEGELLYYDTDHLNTLGSSLVVRKTMRQLLDAGWIEMEEG
ncbi:acyltransferase [Halomonas sp. M5N1S17]|uniref:acyltransferase family protein n=1 Tax=Halomonas alkalisoli TaxID=2907158 RepID=UPI001F326D29|nr:acyltransferase family protein [Halomonas alkalisoli]MCE9662744.1 acyltransferase [Halomonas alkalisoli]